MFFIRRYGSFHCVTRHCTETVIGECDLRDKYNSAERLKIKYLLWNKNNARFPLLNYNQMINIVSPFLFPCQRLNLKQAILQNGIRHYDAFYPSCTSKILSQDLKTQMLHYMCVWEMQKMKEKCSSLEFTKHFRQTGHYSRLFSALTMLYIWCL